MALGLREDLLVHDFPLLEEGSTLLQAVRTMLLMDSYHAIVVRGGRPVGMFTLRDAARALFVEAESGVELLELVSLKQALYTHVKAFMSAPLVTADRTAEPLELVRIMWERNIGAVPVASGPEGRIHGIFSEMSAIKLALELARDRDVCQHASRPLLTIDEDAWVLEAVGLMMQHRVRRLVVTSDAEPIGIVTLKAILHHLFVEEKALERLVGGDLTVLETPVRELMARVVARRCPVSLEQVHDELLKPHGSVLVIPEAGAYGIFTERDVVKMLACGSAA